MSPHHAERSLRGGSETTDEAIPQQYQIATLSILRQAQDDTGLLAMTVK